MADGNSVQEASTSAVTSESSESTVEVNVKTLDSQIYTFRVEKNMPVPLFKEKIANTIGVPVGQQRLIFRGKVLKDEHCLSEYHVEDGHTLHLVARQPVQSQTSTGTNSGEVNANNGNQGNDTSAAAPRNRVGQVSHSVVLGTFNIGDQGEGAIPDLSRIVGAVLNSIGIGNQIPMGGATNISSSIPSTASSQVSQAAETEGTRGNIGGRGGPTFPNLPFQSLPQSLQFPLTGAAVNVPSHQTPIPDSLSTLSEFINRMELVLSVNGGQPSSSANAGDTPRLELPFNSRGLPTPETLSIVMRQAQQLLGVHAVAALSHIAGRLEEEGGATDPAVRNQIQTESVQVGRAMQHLGALFLELGRTILTLRMGQSPAESLVNAGPAIYISPSGPNSIMVQPFPLQTSSLFGGSAAPPPNPGLLVPVGLGDSPRNVNIHIHAGTSLAGVPSVGPRPSTGEVTRGENRNGTSVDSGPGRVLPVRSVIATAVPSRFPMDGSHVRSIVPPSHPRTEQNNHSAASPAQASESASIPTLVAGLNAQIRNLVHDMRGENRVPSGQSEGSNLQGSATGSGVDDGSGNLVAELNEQIRNLVHDMRGENRVPSGQSEGSNLGSVTGSGVDDGSGNTQQRQSVECNQFNKDEETSSFTSKEASTANSAAGPSCSSGETKHPLESEVVPDDAVRSGQSHEHTEGVKTVPLGLGLGGLQPRRRGRQGRSQGSSGLSTNQNQHAITSGQRVLQSLVARGPNARMDENGSSSGQLPPVSGQSMEAMPLASQASSGQFDAASMMSQVLNSPALNGLLAGVSEQAGIGSPDGLRNMFEQFTRNPSMRNTINQITQQIGDQDLGNMFSGMGRGQGGALDLSSMVQQMMPIVSQALARGPSFPESSRVVEPNSQQRCNESRTVRDELNNQTFKVDLRQAAERIERHDPPGDVFRSVVETAARLYGEGNCAEELVDEICSNEDLANEFMEMLCRDMRRRFKGGTGSTGKPLP
ncbi:Ubiquitin domain [Macleaya cordata]|uniref:Ubiquitin domain n=1 Tax=Macleaya cordata TaxID=56857 RepID=A0A200QZX1_MACCD|nr:Ubiquitin domain [Macleaya cordata]